MTESPLPPGVLPRGLNRGQAAAYVGVGVAGALVLRPTGATTGELDITSTNMQITSLDLAMSTTGLTTYTVNFVCDDLTWGAVPA